MNNPINAIDPSGHECISWAGTHCIKEDTTEKDLSFENIYSPEEEAILNTLLSINNPQVADVVAYIKTNDIHIYADTDIWSGAEWGYDGNVYIQRSKLDASDPWCATSALHEAFHLKQGKILARSVFGEQQAWQLQYSAWQDIVGKPWSSNSPQAQLLALPLDKKNSTMAKTEVLMKTIAKPYYYPIEVYDKQPSAFFSWRFGNTAIFIRLFERMIGKSVH